jgi:hypothetical protein
MRFWPRENKAHNSKYRAQRQDEARLLQSRAAQPLLPCAFLFALTGFNSVTEVQVTTSQGRGENLCEGIFLKRS